MASRGAQGRTSPTQMQQANMGEPETPTTMTSDTSMLILQEHSTNEFVFRYLERTDYAKNFPGILGELTRGCDYPVEKFQRRFDELFPS